MKKPFELFALMVVVILEIFDRFGSFIEEFARKCGRACSIAVLIDWIFFAWFPERHFKVLLRKDVLRSWIVSVVLKQ